MGSTFFSLPFFGLILALSIIIVPAIDDTAFLMSPDSDKDVIYRGLTDAEKKALVKANAEFGDSLVENKTFVKGEYEADTLDDNCQCSRENPSCVCLFQMSFINLNVMYAVGYVPADKSIALILAFDGYIIVNDQIKTQEPYKPPCMALPPPTFWMAGCFQMKITEDQGQGFTICGTVDIEITMQARAKHVSSVDLTCFVYGNDNGKHRLELKDHSVDEGGVALKNVRVVKGFEKAAQEFNTLKMVRLMKGESPDEDGDSLHEPFWNEVGPFDFKPPEERSGGPQHTAAMKDWWPLGIDEVPYLTILFKGFVASKLTSAQGIADFRMIKDAINEATAKKGTDWHQTVIPNVFEPGLSCGGALLSPSKVLTLCACIRSFYHHNKHNKPAPGTGSKFDIKVDGNEDIFLEVSGAQFTGKQYHHLDRNPSKYDSQSSCFKLIDSGSEGQQAEMVVMPFTPRIPSDNPYLHVLWPPYPIHEKYKTGPSSNLVAFGTHSKESVNFTDLGGRVIDPKTRAVSILLKRDKMTDYCIKETFQKPQIPDPFKTKTSCFYAKDPKYQLCKGLVGFPITNGDELAGLAASPIDCSGQEGSVMGAVFDDRNVKEIETYLGKDLKTRRTAGHAYLYREPGRIVHIIPDYSTSDATPKPLRGAARRVTSTASLEIFLFVCQISMLIK